MSVLDFESGARERLAASTFGALVDGEIVVDLFCGGGGATQGIEDAGLMVHECVNHCPTAIATHEVNHPQTNHRRGDVWKNKPAVVAAGRPVGLLWASPDCRHFSRARGAAPVSRRVRDLAWVVTRWAKDLSATGQGPRVIIVENVPEFLTWGPIREKRDGRKLVRDASGNVLMEPIPEKSGQTFRKWKRMLERCGYVVDWKVLDAADFGAASRRKRLYVIARRDGLPIVWPEATHVSNRKQTGQGRRVQRSVSTGNSGDRDEGRWEGSGDDRQISGFDAGGTHPSRLAGGNRGRVSAGPDSQGALKPHRTAAEIIDWSDLGTSIFDRKRPLQPKTLARIAEGIRRYVLNDPAPFVLRVTQGDGRGWHVTPADAPLNTQTTRQDLAVCTPVVAPQNGGVYGQRVDEPGPTITTKGHQAVISPVLVGAGGPVYAAKPRPSDQPLNTVIAEDHRAVVSPVLQQIRGDVAGKDVREPIPTITAGNGPGRGAGAAHAIGVSTPVLVTTGYGEREGQRPRCQAIADLLGTCVNGAKQAVVSPVLMSAGGPECAAVPADRPMGTVLPRDHRAIVTPVLMNNTTGHTGGPVTDPAPTVTTGGQAGVVAPVMAFLNHGGKQVGGVDEPLRTVVAGGGHAGLVAALMVSFYGNNKGGHRADMPLHTVTTLDRHGLVCVLIDGVEFVMVDILFRMLKPRELAAAMGFPATYQWPKTQREAVRLIGNAVSPPQAKALTRAVFPRGRGERKAVAG